MSKKYFINIAKLLILPLCCLLGTSSLSAEEVSLEYKGLILNAELELAEGKSLKDGVILITHGSLAHRDMQTLTYLRSLLNEFEHNTLAINLSLGLNNRHGMYDCATPHRHLYEDAVNEIDQWVGWLKDRGVSGITLLGHSKGGAQTALYAVENDNELIKSVILIAPATKTKEGSKELSAQIQRAKMLMAFDAPQKMLHGLSMMHCKKTQASAQSFLSYSQYSPRQDTPTLLPEIKKPTLVLIGGEDEIVVGLEEKVAPLADGKRVRMKVIPTAGHFFRDLNMDEAVEVMDEFLQDTAKNN